MERPFEIDEFTLDVPEMPFLLLKGSDIVAICSLFEENSKIALHRVRVPPGREITNIMRLLLKQFMPICADRGKQCLSIF